MQSALAFFAALLIALTSAAPHVHPAGAAGPDGGHGCLGCVARNGEEAARATPDVAPVAVVADLVSLSSAPSPDAGFPQGAVPGQSPPRA